ncbi:MAG: tetratricopeptide repeat protein [Tannerella sp.]|jgi:tetratricopeptide (TPR) repeat protein|nr:tetratricopeptide repeat protein [Tannerella sp.]
MTIQDIQLIYGQVIYALDKRELKTAFDSLNDLIARSQAGLFRDELNRLQETYKQLLYYYTEGSRDPMQTKIYNELTASAYELGDRIKSTLLAAESSGLYFSVQRTFVAHPESVEMTGAIISSYEVNDIKQAETLTVRLFKRIWSSPPFSEEEMESLHRFIVADDAPPSGNAKGTDGRSILNCQIVSSLILGLQEVFDKRKLLLLTVAAESGDEEVRIRAYTGILITLYLYRYRTDCYPEIKHRLDALAERPEFGKIINLIILRFILSRETEKISNKLRDEIIPEMMKLNPKFNPRTPFPENPEEEMNPEWMETLSEGKLGKQIEEFNRLQEEGADVMHSTFVHLKNFPFFNEISNWFMPFVKSQSLIAADDVIMKTLELITHMGYMCNSDLYSLYFSFKQVPEAGRKIMTGQLESQLSELKEHQMAGLQTKNHNTERIIGQYIQDLYRFYKLYPRRNEFNDIFNRRLDFHNLPVLQAYFSDRNDLLNIADHYLRKNYFEDALTVYERLPGGNDDTIYQKTGYCRQMNGDYEGAIAEYAKAELINPESKWLLRRTAQCYRAIGKPETATGYYLQYEKSDPENLSVLLSIGSCYLERKNYTEALKYYFKVDYLDAGGNKAWRPVAWCSFLTGKYDQARNYYSRILSHKPDSQDYMNAGHTEWVLQNRKGTVSFYKKSVEMLDGDYDRFRKKFDRDIPELAAAGIDPAEIPLILDQLRYSMRG